MKKRIITIAGRPGSGKSSAAKAVTATLGYEHFSSGDLFRALGKEHGIDVLQANLSLEKDPSLNIDALVDGKLQEIGRIQNELVIDSRTAWHWIPDSFKVFLDLDLETAAQRILDSMDDARLASEHIHRDPVEYAGILRERLASETRRYKKLYDIDPYDLSNYDLVIDTKANDLKQVVEQILLGFKAWMNSDIK
jgi:cytidylate kinase